MTSTSFEAEVFSTLGQRSEWESTKQWQKRLRFLQAAIKEIREMDRLAVLSATFYNVKYLDCQYDAGIMTDIRRFDPDSA
mmetsp:Transcript_35490/g.101985  ORF Transcript_35490/g.101985 Transcript_35490/m.101985 type:complete len:80 (+) Transcript_35490:58-297(+)